ncbi:hypothetical protein OAO87_04120 [bacterium]|nr:hypothetical protein [bacterium]
MDVPTTQPVDRRLPRVDRQSRAPLSRADRQSKELWEAAARGETQHVQQLITAGADLDYKPTVRAHTPVRSASDSRPACTNLLQFCPRPPPHMTPCHACMPLVRMLLETGPTTRPPSVVSPPPARRVQRRARTRPPLARRVKHLSSPPAIREGRFWWATYPSANLLTHGSD